MDIFEFKALRLKFAWGGIGGYDCMTFPARWVEECTGVDLVEELRGTYSSKEGAHAILARHGGPLPFMDRHLAIVSAKRVQNPQDGDIGLIRAATSENGIDAFQADMGAVRFGPLWLCIQPGGIRGVAAPFVAAWRLPA